LPDKKDPFVVVLVDIQIEALVGLTAKLARIFRHERWTMHGADKLLQKNDALRKARRSENE
jgi:hypothetical protein